MESGNVKHDQQKTILCVDDEIAILASLARTLRPLPYRVLTATDGVKALAMVKKEKPHPVYMRGDNPHFIARVIVDEL